MVPSELNCRSTENIRYGRPDLGARLRGLRDFVVRLGEDLGLAVPQGRQVCHRTRRAFVPAFPVRSESHQAGQDWFAASRAGKDALAVCQSRLPARCISKLLVKSDRWPTERGRLVRSTSRLSTTVSGMRRLTAPPAGGVARAPVPTTSRCAAARLRRESRLAFDLEDLVKYSS